MNIFQRRRKNQLLETKIVYPFVSNTSGGLGILSLLFDFGNMLNVHLMYHFPPQLKFNVKDFALFLVI